jgi:hypothetical protein
MSQPGFLPIERANLSYMVIRGSRRVVDWDDDIVYINRDGRMVELGTMREMRHQTPPGSNEINDRNGNSVGRSGQVHLYIRNPLVTEVPRTPQAEVPQTQAPQTQAPQAPQTQVPEGGRSRKSRRSRRSRKSRKGRKVRSRRSRRSRK